LRRSAWPMLSLFSCIALFLSGCGGTGGGGADAQLRVLQASPNAPLVNLLVDGVSVAGNLGYGNATAYLQVKPGSHHIQAVPVSGASPIFDQTMSFASSTNQTLLLTGPATGIQPLLLSDTGPTIVVGDAYVRIVDASATMGAADVYIVPAGSSIVGVQPVVAGMSFDQSTGYQTTVAGNYEVFMTAPGTTNALLSTGPISLTSAENQTVVALDSASGGFQYSVLNDQ
jgi:Domain of unknown function (DUF4397)